MHFAKATCGNDFADGPQNPATPGSGVTGDSLNRSHTFRSYGTRMIAQRLLKPNCECESLLLAKVI